MDLHPLRIALAGDQASPLAVLDNVEAGGQDVYVAPIGRYLVGRAPEAGATRRRAGCPPRCGSVSCPRSLPVATINGALI